MRPRSLILLVAIVASLAALAGCTTPQYQTSVRLIPPADAQGRECVEGCEAQKNACQSDCKIRYQACVKDIEPQVEARYLEALTQYETDLKQYAAALRHYEMQLQFDWLNSYHYPYHHPYGWHPWPRPYYPFPYREPAMPTRESVRENLEKTNCQSDCSCLPAYDTCFVGCGGQRLSETVCVKDCPPAR